ncbi:hypothetical protein PBI_SMARTIES_26 [Microbacterium phage Smarties]|uniref:Uncharacterized protein n=1 Tax=Microbacterium phage Ariadne TaxID=2656546 RepID=A0A649VAP0_9CAUD|nr:hypothetical protein QDA10_gp026 [Microbacterium phage Ariadne]QGJ89431.1 hypothetical protein PBI_ARIADNE_26 [Microbacterium phage Ariadne]QGJ91418.1 hypothetical protein PBI_SMARTIES_26 [Microbacterium phage Smarties]
MKFLAGWIAGIATAWAALAIYQRIPPLSEVVWETDDSVVLPGLKPGTEYVIEHARGVRRPGYDDSTARPIPPEGHLYASGGGWIAPSEALVVGSILDDIPEQDVTR